MKFLIVCFIFCVTAQAKVTVLDGRIIGGEEVDISIVPYQVSLRFHDQHLCGGSILNSTVVLTAAQCVHRLHPKFLSIRLGNKISNKGIQYDIDHIIWHPSYNPRTFDYDLAIIKLKKPISFSSNAQPIPLQPKGVEVPEGTVALVSGWGWTSIDGPESRTLQAANLTTVSQDYCIGIYGSSITPRMFCAYADGKSTYNGDAGSPIVAGGNLIGVTSWGPPRCDVLKQPTGFAKVSNMYDWIVTNFA